MSLLDPERPLVDHFELRLTAGARDALAEEDISFRDIKPVTAMWAINLRQAPPFRPTLRPPTAMNVCNPVC